MKPTPKEWKEMEAILSGAYGHVKLRVDSYDIDLYVAKAKALKYAIAVYVNGWIKGEFLVNDCEERRRFCRPRKVFAHTAKFRKLLKTKSKGARKLTAGMDPNETFLMYTPYWGSFRPLKTHLVKNNKSIEWVNRPEPANEDPAYKAAVENA